MQLQRVHNVIHASGAIMLMPRAMWSSLAEPMNAALSSGSFKFAGRTFAYQAGQAALGVENALARSKHLEGFARTFGKLMGTASARERTKFAELLNVTTSAMHDAVMLSRSSADYSDSPAINRGMSQYYRTTGLTQVTNSGRTASAAAAHYLLAEMANDYRSTETGTFADHARDDAKRELSSLGIPPAFHDEFTKWLTAFGPDRPTSSQLMDDPMRGAYGLAIRRLADRAYQDPYKVDRAVMSGRPLYGLGYALMSFNYQFQRNVISPAWMRVEHSYGRAKLEALNAGQGKLRATARGLTFGGGTAAWGMGAAAALVGANMLTSLPRQWLFAKDEWDKHEADGDLWPWLLELGMTRSGLNGTLDPLMQAWSHVRYNADLSSLTDGAYVNFYLKNAQDLIMPSNDETEDGTPAGTNTRNWKRARAAYNLIGVPGAAVALSALNNLVPGGPALRVATGGAMQYVTSPEFSGKVANWWAGWKGVTADGGSGKGGLPTLPKAGGGLPKLPKPGAGGSDSASSSSGVGAAASPLGLIDDIAIPLWQKVIAPVVNKVPTPLKALTLGAVVAGGLYHNWAENAPFRAQPKPEPKAR
jgi:hypothetical protein